MFPHELSYYKYTQIEQYCMIKGVMLSGLVRLRLGMSKAQAVDGAPRLTVHALNKDE